MSEQEAVQEQQQEDVEVTATAEEYTSTTTADEHEYQRKKIRKAWQILTEVGKSYEETAKHFTEELTKMLDIIFREHPKWSIKRALTQVYNENRNLGWKSPNHLYAFLDDKHQAMIRKYDKDKDKSSRKDMSQAGLFSSSRFFSETPQETLQRLEQEKAEMEADAAKVRRLNDITEEDQPEIEQGHEKCFKKYMEMKHRLEDKDEQIKRLQTKVGFYNHGEIRLDYSKLEECMRDFAGDISSVHTFIITQQKGYAIHVRAEG